VRAGGSEQVCKERDCLGLSLIAGPQNTHQHLLRIRTVRGLIASPDFPRHLSRADRLLGPEVRGFQAWALQVGKEVVEFAIEMIGQSSLLCQAQRSAQHALEFGFQSAGRFDQTVFGDLTVCAAAPLCESLLQEPYHFQRQSRCRRLLDHSVGGIDKVTVAALMIGRLEPKADRQPVTDQESVGVLAREDSGLVVTTSGENRVGCCLRGDGDKEPPEVPSHLPFLFIHRDAGSCLNLLHETFVGWFALCGYGIDALAQAARCHRQAEAFLQDGGSLAEWNSQSLIQHRRQRQCFGPQLRRCGAQSFRGLAGVAALDRGSVINAVADMHSEPCHVNLADNLGLLLVLHVQVPDFSIESGTGSWQRYLDFFIHLNGNCSMGFWPVVRTSFSTRHFALLLGLAFGEGGGLTFPGPPRQFQLLLRTVPLLAELLLAIDVFRVFAPNILVFAFNILNPFSESNVERFHLSQQSSVEGICSVENPLNLLNNYDQALLEDNTLIIKVQKQ